MPCFHCTLPVTADNVRIHGPCVLHGFETNKFQSVKEFIAQSEDKPVVRVLRRYMRVLPRPNDSHA
jgi:hypothetical protein